MNFKFFTSFVAVAALLALVGCEKGPTEPTDNPGGEGEGVTRFMATIETPEVSRAILATDNCGSIKYLYVSFANFGNTNPSALTKLPNINLS